MPDPSQMTEFCREGLPKLLRESGVDPDEAAAIGDDVLARSQAFTGLPDTTRDVVIAPSIEEIYSYEPRDADLALLAAVNVVVRNSRLEEAHANGPLTSKDIRLITTAAVAPLSQLLTGERHENVSQESDMFIDLKKEYPRAWACLQALSDTIPAGGGPTKYRHPGSPVPPLPESEELVDTRAARKVRAQVQSGVDPRFDGELIAQIRQAASTRIPLFVLSLSRISRNTAKLFRTLEMALARDVTLVTANYLLRSGDVWVRRGPFVTPDARHPKDAMTTTGLSGAHRKAVKAIAEQLRR